MSGRVKRWVEAQRSFREHTARGDVIVGPWSQRATSMRLANYPLQQFSLSRLPYQNGGVTEPVLWQPKHIYKVVKLLMKAWGLSDRSDATPEALEILEIDLLQRAESFLSALTPEKTREWVDSELAAAALAEPPADADFSLEYRPL